jgi:adenine deaminase
MKKQISGNIVDIFERQIFPGTVYFENGVITQIKKERRTNYSTYILPGFVDSHIHIESSMLPPSEFARIAVRFGTVATVSDPHEIANVLGIEGILFMLEDGRRFPFKFYFGASSCVPATDFETSGAHLTSKDIELLLKNPEIKYLSEMMNFPGVINNNPDVVEKINIAKKLEKPIDGHAPALRGEMLDKYIAAGIATDHESFLFEEAEEKIRKGMKILVREGSSAKNFDELFPLLQKYPNMIMFCSDDLHPNDLVKGHIATLVARSISKGADLFDVLRAVSLNPVVHYGLDVGLLRIGDDADFIVVEDLKDFRVIETYIEGILVAKDGQSMFEHRAAATPNKFYAKEKTPSDFALKPKGKRIRVVEAIDGELITNSIVVDAKIKDDNVISDTENDVLKIVVVNRYADTKPAIGFAKNFGLKHSAIATSVAHDSHNVIAIGVSDELIAKAVNIVIRNGGGLSFVTEENEIILPLPIAGLMSTLPAEEVAKVYSRLEDEAKKDGSSLTSPFMTLSFMSLLVIPSLKLGDSGLFDVNQFQFVNLFVD